MCDCVNILAIAGTVTEISSPGLHGHNVLEPL